MEVVELDELRHDLIDTSVDIFRMGVCAEHAVNLACSNKSLGIEGDGGDGDAPNGFLDG